MSSTIVGVAVSICGNTLVAFSLNAQKFAHLKNVNNVNYLKLPLWWVGMIMMVFGEIGNFVAYGFAPAVIVAPLGAVSVIINGIMGKFCKFLEETMRLRDLLGYIFAVGGSIIIVVFSPHTEDPIDPSILAEYMINPIFLTYFIFMCTCLGVVFYLSKKNEGALGKKYSVVYLSICSMLGSITVMATKGLSTFMVGLFEGTSNPFTNWITYFLVLIIASTTVNQMRYLNLAMEHFGASEVVPVYYVMFTGLSIIGGIVLYREFANMQGSGIGMFILGCIVTFSGVYLITSKRKSKSLQKDKNASESQASAMVSLVDSASSSGGEPDHKIPKKSENVVTATSIAGPSSGAALISRGGGGGGSKSGKYAKLDDENEHEGSYVSPDPVPAALLSSPTNSTITPISNQKAGGVSSAEISGVLSEKIPTAAVEGGVSKSPSGTSSEGPLLTITERRKLSVHRKSNSLDSVQLTKLLHSGSSGHFQQTQQTSPTSSLFPEGPMAIHSDQQEQQQGGLTSMVASNAPLVSSPKKDAPQPHRMFGVLKEENKTDRPSTTPTKSNSPTLKTNTPPTPSSRPPSMSIPSALSAIFRPINQNAPTATGDNRRSDRSGDSADPDAQNMRTSESGDRLLEDHYDADPDRDITTDGGAALLLPKSPGASPGLHPLVTALSGIVGLRTASLFNLQPGTQTSTSQAPPLGDLLPELENGGVGVEGVVAADLNDPNVRRRLTLAMVQQSIMMGLQTSLTEMQRGMQGMGQSISTLGQRIPMETFAEEVQKGVEQIAKGVQILEELLDTDVAVIFNKPVGSMSTSTSPISSSQNSQNQGSMMLPMSSLADQHNLDLGGHAHGHSHEDSPRSLIGRSIFNSNAPSTPQQKPVAGGDSNNNGPAGFSPLFSARSSVFTPSFDFVPHMPRSITSSPVLQGVTVEMPVDIPPPISEEAEGSTDFGGDVRQVSSQEMS